MLTISPPMSGAGQGDYYLSLAREDYYTKGGEPPGEWLGSGANELGVKGQVKEEELKNVLAGYSPDGKEALVQNAGDENRQSGWDLTFSAPKSISVIWSQADPETRREIQLAQKEAVGKAVGYLEDEAAFTRRGKGGSEREETKLTFAAFEHGTSRAQDPQLHTHVLLLNVGTREDGTTGTVESKPIFKHKMAAGAVYRAELAHQLETRLGFEPERKKNWFEVKGVPEDIAQEFSKRRKEVEAALQESGFSGPVAAKVAALNTRAVKEHVAREDLFEQWQKVGNDFGFGGEQVKNLQREKPLERDPQKEQAESISIAVRRITDRDSHFSKRDVVRHAAEEAQGRGLSADQVIQSVDSYLSNSDQVVRLGRFDGEERYTTKEMIDLEGRMLAQVKARKGEDSQRVPNATVDAVFQKRATLSAEQKNAVTHITQAPGGVQIVSGMAGTGKSYMLETAREAWEKEGYTVLGAAPSGKAARELESSSGIKSATTHRTLGQIERGELTLNKSTVLVVDEAGMVGTRQMSRLVEETNRNGAKLVLVGDAKQLQSVDAGGAFRAFGEELGQAELKDIRRQREEWARGAVKNFAHGEADAALSEYAKRGLVTVENSRKQAIDSLVSEWKKDGIENPQANLIIASTNLDAKVLNEKAQAARFKGEQLGEESLSVNGNHLYAGDRVLFTKNSKKLGVENGALGTVEKIDEKRGIITAKLDSGKTTEIDTKQYPDMKLGYAITTHKSQGSTVENAHILLGGSMQDRELSYVQASRARGQTHFYIDKAEAGENLAQVARAMKTSHGKQLATSLKQQASSPRHELKQEISRAR